MNRDLNIKIYFAMNNINLKLRAYECVNKSGEGRRVTIERRGKKRGEGREKNMNLKGRVEERGWMRKEEESTRSRVKVREKRTRTMCFRFE